MSTARRSKKAVNVSISADLLQAARNSELNLSATLEAAVEHELRQLRKREWLERNENAIQAYNSDVEEQGALLIHAGAIAESIAEQEYFAYVIDFGELMTSADTSR